ncbi:hypothetical protein ADEAN_000831200 [Angomonas deanei]|uniref:Uncharacterized protein n=1 Tax=Angomonas deanei TaxID=59799 RepID=A0A7G2CN03_9TRYP|nr:hypothetical protein ADEAN_000831200 [Angomonas deanei]
MSLGNLYVALLFLLPSLYVLWTLYRLLQHVVRRYYLEDVLPILYTHSMVSVTVLPIAALGAIGVALTYNNALEFVQKNLVPLAREGGLLQRSEVLPLPVDVTLMEVQLVGLLILLAYGCTIVLHHLIDITRLLKISRRRLVQPETNAERALYEKAQEEMKKALAKKK